MIRRPPRSTLTETLFPDTTRCRSNEDPRAGARLGTAGPIHGTDADLLPRPRLHQRLCLGVPRRCPVRRSEEHTFDLQSLIRTSYAVFCLQHKPKPPATTTHFTYSHL